MVPQPVFFRHEIFYLVDTLGLPGSIPIHDVFLRHKQIIGSTMGSDEYVA
jgi:hypothetical protein